MTSKKKTQAIPLSEQNVIIIDMTQQGKSIPIDIKKIKLYTPENVKTGVYSNTLRVSATNTEVILDFVYMMPTEDGPDGTVVSRVVIPPAFTEHIVKSLNQVIKDHEKAK